MSFRMVDNFSSFTSDNYVQKLIEMEEYDNLQDLLLSGYDKFEVVLDKFKEQSNLPEDTQRFLTEIPEFQVM